jgi:hypothetical protein
MIVSPHGQCCCNECVEARHAFVRKTHPLHSKKCEEQTKNLYSIALDRIAAIFGGREDGH